jgi:hypothetical protein
VAHLGVDRRQDAVPAGAAVEAGHAVLVDLEVLAHQLAQQAVRLPDGLLLKQPVGPLDRAQRPLRVLGHARQHPLPLRALAPATVRLLRRPRVVELESAVETAGRLLIDRPYGVDQLLDPRPHQPHRVPGRGGTEHRRRIDDLLGRGIQQPQLLGQRKRVLKRQALLAVQQQAGPIARQRARAPARVVDRQPERNLPAQVPRHRLHRPLIRAARPILQQQHLGQLRRRDRGTADAVGVTVGEILIPHDPLAMLGQQSEQRTIRQRPDQLGRVEKPNLARRRRKHARKDPDQAGRDRAFSAAS